MILAHRRLTKIFEKSPQPVFEVRGDFPSRADEEVVVAEALGAEVVAGEGAGDGGGDLGGQVWGCGGAGEERGANR